MIEAAAALLVVTTLAWSAGAAINRANSREAKARDRAALLEKQVVAQPSDKTASPTASNSGDAAAATANSELGAVRAQVQSLAAPFEIAVSTMRPRSSAFEVNGSLVTFTGVADPRRANCPSSATLSTTEAPSSSNGLTSSESRSLHPMAPRMRADAGRRKIAQKMRRQIFADDTLGAVHTDTSDCRSAPSQCHDDEHDCNLDVLCRCDSRL